MDAKAETPPSWIDEAWGIRMMQGSDAFDRDAQRGPTKLSARDAELVRTLEANGLDRLAAAVRRQILRDRALTRGLLPERPAGRIPGPRADRERSLSPAPLPARSRTVDDG